MRFYEAAAAGVLLDDEPLDDDEPFEDDEPPPPDDEPFDEVLPDEVPPFGELLDEASELDEPDSLAADEPALSLFPFDSPAAAPARLSVR